MLVTQGYYLIDSAFSTTLKLGTDVRFNRITSNVVMRYFTFILFQNTEY